jgi:hypothetical protein
MITIIDETYLESIERVKDLFDCGRPLIRDTLEIELTDGRLSFQKYIRTSIFESGELQFLLGKICNIGIDASWEEDKFKGLVISNAARFSILGFSVGISSFPSSIKIEELVEKNLMTLLYVDNNNMNQITGFFPEGPLNSVASWYLCKYFSQFFDNLGSLSFQGICDIGLFGEIIARIILLCCKFYSTDPSLTLVRKFIFFSLPLKTFLETLTGDKNVTSEYFTSNPELEGSSLNFSYFQPLISTGYLNPYKAMMQCFINGSAAFLRHNYPGVDFLIPLILKGGRMSFLAVQVKLNRDFNCNQNIFVPIYENMSFSSMFGVDNLSLYDRTHALLILSLHNKDRDKQNPKNEVFVMDQQYLASYRTKHPSNQSNPRKKRRKISENDLPPALVICGCSFRFGHSETNLYEIPDKNKLKDETISDEPDIELEKSKSEPSDELNSELEKLNIKPRDEPNNEPENSNSKRSAKLDQKGKYKSDYKTIFEELIYVYSPKLNTIRGLEPDRFEELEALYDSISANPPYKN